MQKKILIVEDDIEIQDILKNYLTDAGYEVRVEADGVEGISEFDEDISLVLLDVMLPKIDGFGVCEVIRSKSQVPIIMLTALADEENQVRGFKQQIIVNAIRYSPDEAQIKADISVLTDTLQTCFEVWRDFLCPFFGQLSICS